MDKKRNIELENWLIETTGEEMMANHLGPNWNRFHEECGFYPNISMTIADQVWEHQQKRIDELNKCHLSRVAELTRLNKVKVSKIIELQAKVDAALQEIKGAARWIDEDAIDDPEFIKGGALRALKRLEQALKGGEA